MRNPEDHVEESLARARQHLRRSTLEGLEALRALLEATLRASSLYPPARGSMIGQAGHQLERLIENIREGREFRLPSALAEPLAAAIDGEIERWEKRSQTDPDARPVLRVFLGLRELLWEFGLRSPDAAAAPPEPEDPAETRSPRKPHPKRVQRFDVEG